MRRRRNLGLIVLVLLGLSTGALVGQGCSASAGHAGAGGSAGSSSGETWTTSSGTSSSSGDGGGLFIPDAGGDVAIDVAMNPCGTQCGPMELCDDFHLGLDDDCDGEADEDCSCSTGQVHACFLGDPSYRGSAGCFDGTEKCSENGKWGPCIGGVHATQMCFSDNQIGCHAISGPPFVPVDLKTGTGNFSADAIAGTESWTVQCPNGVSPCPAVTGANPPDDFQPLQSGEYTVTYTKQVAGGSTLMCTYPLFVGAPGLRVELSWEHDLGGTGVDLDLHLHRPNDTSPWNVDGVSDDCGYANCTISAYTGFPIGIPDWFPAANQPPAPVGWWKDSVLEKNTCYFAPRGVGDQWKALDQGCYNPRLDLDNISCTPSIKDPNDTDFCAPENINVDFPPKGEWFRVGVYYYDNPGENYDVHPNVKIFCDGALTAELGSKGFNDPESPITFKPGEGSSGLGNRFWFVADVAFRTSMDQCAAKGCVVQPIYADPVKRTPVFSNQAAVNSSFGPPYPPPP